ncbi:hypothetical protein FI667_g3973, partial [Globisporangium splendens]
MLVCTHVVYMCNRARSEVAAASEPASPWSSRALAMATTFFLLAQTSSFMMHHLDGGCTTAAVASAAAEKLRERAHRHICARGDGCLWFGVRIRRAAVVVLERSDHLPDGLAYSGGGAGGGVLLLSAKEIE